MVKNGYAFLPENLDCLASRLERNRQRGRVPGRVEVASIISNSLYLKVLGMNLLRVL